MGMSRLVCEDKGRVKRRQSNIVKTLNRLRF